jgi:phosphopentomutase
MRMIFIFLDGLGIGERDPQKNPYYSANTSNFEYLIKKFGVYETDATLGVPGLPQSATGQTTIYTGVNASKAIGRHWSARPTQELRDIILQDNLFISMKKAGRSVTFANVYTQEYLDKMQKTPRGIFKPSVTTLQCLSSNTPFRLLDDYLKGYGVCHDIIGRRLAEAGYDVPLITPENAAENLYRVSREYDLTLFEFFLTDIQGHSMDMEKAIYELELLNQVLGRLIELIDFSEDVLLITSDHGNIEDLTVRTHTLNSVPTIVAGDSIDRDSIRIKSLMDIKPSILKMFKI